MSPTLNPVLGRELTERLRGLRAFVALAVFVLILTLTAFLVFTGAESASSFDLAARTRVGRLMFETVLLIMTVLVLFFVPGLTAGAVAGERERQTLATMQVTMLRPRSILFGKIAAALSYIVLMLIAALPVLAVAYVLGGIRVVDIARGILAVGLLAVALATMIVAISTFARRVQTATVLAYAFTALLVIAGPLAFGIGQILDARDVGENDVTIAPAGLLTLNPIVLVADLATGNSVADDTPLSAIVAGLAEAKADNDGRWWALFPDRPGRPDFFDVADDIRPGAPFEENFVGGRRPDGGLAAWVLSAGSMALLSAVLFWAASRRLRAPAEVER